jgi:radical SAM protein with 4Fe4S-binding SPASM domain
MMGAIPLFERLQIESQSHCNRSCWFCPRTYDRSGAYLDGQGAPIRNRMPTAKILELLDQAQALGFRGRVGFHHYSEPLLDRRSVALAREARRRGMEPYLHTNGDALRDRDALCEEIRGVYSLVVVGLYDYESNQQLEVEKRFWRERLAGVPLQFSAIGPFGALKADSNGIPRASVPSDPRMALPDLTFPNAPCQRPAIRMIVRHDGEMILCCEDVQAQFGLGNVYRATLAQLWYSERHVRLVEALRRGRRERFELCRRCPQPPSGPARDGARIEIARRAWAPERASL